MVRAEDSIVNVQLSTEAQGGGSKVGTDASPGAGVVRRVAADGLNGKGASSEYRKRPFRKLWLGTATRRSRCSPEEASAAHRASRQPREPRRPQPEPPARGASSSFYPRTRGPFESCQRGHSRAQGAPRRRSHCSRGEASAGRRGSRRRPGPRRPPRGPPARGASSSYSPSHRYPCLPQRSRASRPYPPQPGIQRGQPAFTGYNRRNSSSQALLRCMPSARHSAEPALTRVMITPG